MHGSPSCHRPAAVPPASSNADRSASASLEVSLASLRRSLVAPYRPERPAPDHPASALFPTSAPTPGGRLARAVFSASRLALLFSCMRCQTPPRGSFVADFSLAYVPDPRRLLSRPGRDRQSPGDAHGIHYRPSQFCFRPRVTTPVRTSRTHLPFCHAPPRVSSSRGPSLVAWTIGLWPRLLGFGPASEPCRVICRPRYSFYA